MKKQPNKYTLLSFLIGISCWLCVPILAQQNQKVLLPNPDGFTYSSGSYVRPTSDGGYITVGSAGYINGFAGYDLPRAIKSDATLQTEWDNTYLDPAEHPNGIYANLVSPPLELTDGGFAFGISDTASGFDVLRLAADGNLLWGKDFPGWQNDVYPLTPLPNGGFLAARSHLPGQSGWKSYILEFDANGDIAAEHQIEEVPYVNGAILLTGGDALTVHRLQSNYVFTRVDAISNVVWQTAPIAGLSTTISPMPDGGFAVISRVTPGNFRVHFFDDQGNQTGQTPTLLLPINQIFSLGFYPDGTFLIGGQTSINRGFMARIQPDGSVVWAAESLEDGQEHLQYLSAHPTADGWGIGAGGTNFATSSQTGLLRVSENSGIFVNVITGKIGYDSDEDCLLTANESGIPHAQIRANNGTQNFYAFSDDDGAYLMILPAGDYTLTASVATQLANYEVCPGLNLDVSFPVGVNGSATLDIPMHAGQILHQISGKLWLDQNSNCTADNGDLVLKNWVVRLNDESGNTLVTTFTNQNGTYSFIISAGNYSVTAIPYNQNFSFCDPATQLVTVSGAIPQYAVADFVAEAETDCAQMRVSIQPIGVRPCIERTFNVNYRNDGTVPAENATLEVILPQGMVYVSATPAPASVNGNTLLFELGEVLPSPGDLWTFVAIRISGDCDLEIGDELCVIANITPEELCGTAPGWNGAIMALEGECDENGNAVFTVKNIGNAPNTEPRRILIIEDQIVLYEDDISLNPMAELVLPPLTSSDTSTIVATVEQEPGFPGDDLVVFSLNNCLGTGGSPTGFGGNAGPFTATKCFLVVNSYDPNDKNANPLGFGEAHSVRPGTPIEYTIRFQNTGNDTAYLVVLRDTLSQNFNAARTEVLGASHPYEFALLNENILHFAFKNILLPDSTTNLEASQGYILFRVYPKADLAQGTVVENNAAIYFDFNEPIITNTVFRTYEDFILVKTDEVRHPQALDITIYPNPFSTQTTFELPEGAPAGDYALELYDAAGRQLRSMAFDGTRCMVTRNALPAGLLFWKISREGRMVASGKMIAE